jgi:hypothetical protein
MDDITKIMALPNIFSSAFFNLLVTEDDITFPDARVAILKSDPTSKISHLHSLEVKKVGEYKLVESELFKKTGVGETVTFGRTLLHLNLARGSTESLQFLSALSQVPAKNDLMNSVAI